MVAPTRANAKKKRQQESISNNTPTSQGISNLAGSSSNNETAPTRENAARLEQEKPKTQAANKNAALLNQFGSPEAKARNEELQGNPTAPTQKNANDLKLQELAAANKMISENTDEATSEFTNALSNTMDGTTGDLSQYSTQGLLGVLAGSGLVLAGSGRLGGAVKGGRAILTSLNAFGKRITPRTGQISRGVGSLKPTAKNMRLIKKTLITTGISSGALYVISTIGVKLWGQHLQGEAGEAPQFALDEATYIGERTGDWSYYDQLIQGLNEAEELDSSGAFNTVFPYAYAGEAAELKIRNTGLASEVYEEYGRIKRQVQETGGDPNGAEFWTQYQQEKTNDEERIAEQWLANRKEYLRLEQEAKAQNRAADEAYWKRQNELAIKKEKELLKLREEYWQRVREAQQKYLQNRSPSQLSFGLL